MNTPYSVALTGGIGSGKSTIASLFSKHGVPIIDTDIVAREIVSPGQPTLEKVIELFGKKILLPSGNLDRAKLRKIVFESDSNKSKLETILHPLIFNAISQQLQQLSVPYCIVVIPLLIETDTTKKFDRILVVDVPEKIQIQRTVARDNASKNLIENIINKQSSRNTRLLYADDIIVNTVTLNELEIRIDKLHERYLFLAEQKHKLNKNTKCRT